MRYTRGLAIAALTVFIFLLFPSTSQATRELVISDSLTYTPLGGYFDLLKDPEGSFTFEEVASGAHGANFTMKEEDIYSLGWSWDIIWLRLEVRNDTRHHKEAIIEMPVAWFDKLQMFTPSTEGLHVQRSGDRWPFLERSIPHRDHLFHLALEPGEKKTVFIRAEAEDAMVLPFYFWTENAYYTHDSRMGMLFGFLYGILGALMVYNLFVYYSVRDKSYLYYIAYILGWLLFLFSMNGSGYEYLWPGNPYWGNRAPLFFAVLANLFGGLYAREFLGIRRALPNIDRYVRVGIWFCGFMLPISVFFPYYRYADMLGTTSLTMIFGPLLLVAAALCYRKGVRQARFFILAWFFQMVGMMVFGLGCFNILPFSFFTTHSVDIGATIEALLLSLALADKINIIRTENKMAEARVAETLRQANEDLEAKVAHRTASLNLAKEEAENATRLKDKFVALVSHDLRSPLGTMMGLLRLLKQRGNTIDHTQKDLTMDRVIKSGDALLALINELLDISRLKTGAIRPKKVFLRPADIAAEVIQKVEPAADQKQVRLVNDIPREMRVVTDRPLYHEVLLNLVTNAIKFSRAGDTITLSTPSGQPGVVLVSDTGVGIPPEMVQNLFNAEVKTSTVGTGGEYGTGLGLPYCFEILAAHGGQLSVESEVGKGSTFRIALPVYDYVICLVDDQEAHRNMMKEAIRGIVQTEFLEAENGISALTAMANGVPDLIVTDIEMDGMSGIELLTAVRNHPKLSSVPVIVATSAESSPSNAEVRAKIMELGANSFVLKPIVISEFSVLVRRHLKIPDVP